MGFAHLLGFPFFGLRLFLIVILPINIEYDDLVEPQTFRKAKNSNLPHPNYFPISSKIEKFNQKRKPKTQEIMTDSLPVIKPSGCGCSIKNNSGSSANQPRVVNTPFSKPILASPPLMLPTIRTTRTTNNTVNNTNNTNNAVNNNNTSDNFTNNPVCTNSTCPAYRIRLHPYVSKPGVTCNTFDGACPLALAAATSSGASASSPHLTPQQLKSLSQKLMQPPFLQTIFSEFQIIQGAYDDKIQEVLLVIRPMVDFCDKYGESVEDYIYDMFENSHLTWKRDTSPIDGWSLELDLISLECAEM